MTNVELYNKVKTSVQPRLDELTKIIENKRIHETQRGLALAEKCGIKLAVVNMQCVLLQAYIPDETDQATPIED